MFGWILTANQAIGLAGWMFFALHLVVTYDNNEKEEAFYAIGFALICVSILS